MGAESRRLEVRHGLKKGGEERKQYVHMLNGTLCATERAMCCVVENWQTPEVGPLSPFAYSFPRIDDFTIAFLVGWTEYTGLDHSACFTTVYAGTRVYSMGERTA